MEKRISLDELLKKYKLSEEEHKRIGNIINENMLYGKISPKKPFAIIDIAPPGSGKTGLNGYAVKQFEEDGIVVVNNDELKPYHPKADEIVRLYPEYYTKITNEDSKFWTDDLVEKAINAKVNVLYEGTGRNVEVLRKMIAKLKGYLIVIRAMAVNELNCLMSIIERYEGQVEKKGWGRIVSADTFYKAYNEEMVETIDRLERTGMADMFEVYMRGEKPSEPVRIYSSIYKEFIDAKSAIIYGRERDREKAEQYYKNKFKVESFITKEFPEVRPILNKINELI